MSEETSQPDEHFPAGAEKTPFHVVVRKTSASLSVEASEDAGGPDEESISLEEIEAAYLRALESADLAESQSLLEFESQELSPQSHAHLKSEEKRGLDSGEPEQASSEVPRSESVTNAGSVEPLAMVPQDLQEESGGDVELPAASAEQVVEALLFVGGAPLPVKKFLDVLGGTHSVDQVEGMVGGLNARYAAQRRPYEIRLMEGGYQLQLVSAYEGIRARAYGHGPKEVKLAQDALEVLAFIAYQQPVDRDALNGIGKTNLPGLLRQLLRRELICVDRSDPELGENYRSTPRFLELFGLSSLEDLPQAGTFQFR